MDPSLVTRFRYMKKTARNLLELSYCKDNDEIQGMVEKLVLMIPHRTEKFLELKDADISAIQRLHSDIVHLSTKLCDRYCEAEKEGLNQKQRGGKREGAGRKSFGVKKPVSIALPQSVWDDIDDLIQNGQYKSYADFFRSATGFHGLYDNINMRSLD